MMILELESNDHTNHASELLTKPAEGFRVISITRAAPFMRGIAFIDDNRAEVVSGKWSTWAKEIGLIK